MKAINFLSSGLNSLGTRMSRQDFLLDKINMTVNKDVSHYKGVPDHFGYYQSTQNLLRALGYDPKTLPDDGKLY